MDVEVNYSDDLVGVKKTLLIEKGFSTWRVIIATFGGSSYPVASAENCGERRISALPSCPYKHQVRKLGTSENI